MTWIAPWAAFCLLALIPAAAPAETPSRARANLVTLFSDEDYPAAAVRNHEEGPVGFRLDVGADGRPSGCSVISSSGSAILDSTTCRLLMERARFEPARDAQGQPTPDSVVGRIVWRLPDDAPPRLQAVHLLWTNCVIGEASKLAPGALPAEDVARRSFPPCAALEALVAGELRIAPPIEESRASMTRTIVEEIGRMRAALKKRSAD